MYQYGKQRSKVSVSPKEPQIFGPQFGIQNSVGERPMKQMMVSGRDVNVLRANNLLTNQQALSRSGSGSAEQLSSQQTVDKIAQYSRNNAFHKRIVPTATALVHDLNTPELGSGGGEDDGTHQHLSASMSSRNQKGPAFLPGDRVVFAENPSTPGVPVVYRVAEERAANPDRLNLDRRRLTVCPILEGEDQLRLLNYQHNLLTRITHLSSLRRLIFLDLYDNQIEEISGLNSLKSLRVLMLGKNKIRRIENLNSLLKLDVLDLHGNQISVIENLNHLTELRVLNLAGNQLTHVTNLLGMDALAELNLRRNRIRTVVDVDNLPSLQRLFLSFNEITSFDDISCLGDSHSLSELSLDGNPFSQDPHYKQTVLRHMTQLRQLDMKRVSEDERRIATVMARKEEEKKRESNKIAVMKEKRRLAINNAKRQWEAMQGTMIHRDNKIVRMPELFAHHVGSYTNDPLEVDQPEDKDIIDIRYSDHLNTYTPSRPTSAKSLMSEGGCDTLSSDNSKQQGSRSSSRASLVQSSDKDRILSGCRDGSETNVCHLAELEGETLNLYGGGSVDALDKNWGIQAAGSVTTIKFKFIDFDEISPHFHKIRARFPNVTTLHFSATNIHSLQQLNALSSVRRLDNLVIEPDGNPILQYSLWKTYALFRLAHFSVRKINDTEVSASDIVNAEKLFGTLAHMTTQLPQSRLLSMLGETRKKHLLSLSEEKSKKADTKLSEKANSESVGRAGLVYNAADTLQAKIKEKNHRLDLARSYTRELSMEAAMIEHKKVALQKLFPQLMQEMVQNAVMEMCDTDAYMKQCMQELENS